MDEQAFDRIQCIELLTNCYYKSEEKQAMGDRIQWKINVYEDFLFHNEFSKK